MNSINIVGRLVQDPELQKTKSGKSVCSFSLAVSRPRVKDTTDFIDCEAWNQSAEYLTSYGRKGNLVAVTGVLTSHKYEDKSGHRRTDFKVVCDIVSVCESKNKNKGGVETPPTFNPSYNDATEPSAQFTDMDNDDELPF